MRATEQCSYVRVPCGKSALLTCRNAVLTALRRILAPRNRPATSRRRLRLPLRAPSVRGGLLLPRGRRRCDNAWMTRLTVALANLKPGTGKTTSAVWLAHVFAQAGNSVLLVDADPSGSALEWSDLAAMNPGVSPQAAFPFRIVALPSRELHRRIPDIAQDDDVVMIDTPQSWRTTPGSPARPCGTSTRSSSHARRADRDQPHHPGQGGDRRGGHRCGTPRPARWCC